MIKAAILVVGAINAVVLTFIALYLTKLLWQHEQPETVYEGSELLFEKAGEIVLMSHLVFVFGLYHLIVKVVGKGKVD